MDMMTEKQAYAAMYHFLKEYWQRGQSLGDVLSYMSLLPDGSPADAAVTQDWRQAVRFALEGGSADGLAPHPRENSE